MREKALLAPSPHPVDESSNGDEPLERKRRRLDLGKGVAIEANGSGASGMAPVSVFMVDAILSGRSPQMERVGPGAGSVRSAEGGVSSNVGGPHVKEDGSGSDVVSEDVDECLGRHTSVEVKTDGSDCHMVIPGSYNLLLNSEQVSSALAPLCAAPKSETLGTMSDTELSRRVAGMALQTLVMEVERERRERRRTGLYKKMSSKYHQYHAKHRAMSNIYHQDPKFQVFREGLKQQEDQLERRVEELEERDEELVRAIACNSELEALLKVKEDELELSQGVMAENTDLQLKEASLTVELDAKAVEVDGLKGELNASADKLTTTISKTVSLEDALSLSRSELTGEKENFGRRIVGFDGRVRELEAELALLQGQMALLRSYEVNHRSQPSTSRPSTG
ncbi:uncharacterized protein [Nicotiana sylvestris]|uniref:uncharacterized protein n=1 Tax=Nicotiana sylvestris TaxID=4096 RepID=UPI00388CC763